MNIWAKANKPKLVILDSIFFIEIFGQEETLEQGEKKRAFNKKVESGLH